MSYSKRKIERFMRIGKPRVKFFLWWAGRESFFDDDVQAVLEKWHPNKINYPGDEFKACPIDAWSAADSFSLGQSYSDWHELHPFAQHDPLWTLELLTAVIRYRQSVAKSALEPRTALEIIEAWRKDRYLREKPVFRYSHARAVKHNTMVKRLTEHPPKDIRFRISDPAGERTGECGIPLRISEPLKPPIARMDGRHKRAMSMRLWGEERGVSLSQVAYRKAAKEENDRRNRIMCHWAECWISHLRGGEKALP